MDGFVLNEGNTAWVLVSAALVLMMTPALAVFYGGMVRSKSVLNIMMMCFSAIAVVAVVYSLWGYSMSFGPDTAGGLFGDPFALFGIESLANGDPSNALASSGVPIYAWIGLQATFAIITLALLSGAVADRTRFSSWLVLVVLWCTFVYFPLSHMVWGGGLLSADGPIGRAFSTPMDLAGGTVVEIASGMGGLMLAIVLGKRRGFGIDPMRPHNLPLVMLGAGLLWFGWFGFNAGSAGAADGFASLAWVDTCVSAAVAMLAWLLTERIRDGKATSLGAASGVVVGLVAATPSAGFVTPLGAMAIGVVAGVLGALAVALKFRFGYDDSLDLVAVHFVGGFVGTVLIGVFATGPNLLEGAQEGLLYGGGVTQLVTQTLLAVSALVFVVVMTAIIGFVLRATMGVRVSADVEASGVDLALHGESAYEGIVSGRLGS